MVWYKFHGRETKINYSKYMKSWFQHNHKTFNGDDFRAVNGVVGFGSSGHDSLVEGDMNENSNGTDESVDIDVDHSSCDVDDMTDMIDGRGVHDVSCDRDIRDVHCVTGRHLYVVVRQKRAQF